MAGGGKKQTTTETRDPWGPAAPFLTDSLSRVGDAAKAPYTPFPGPLTVGPTNAENAAWQRQFSFDNGTFGTTPQLSFGDTAGAYQQMLGGGNFGGVAGALPQIASATARSVMSGPAQIGRYGFDTSINPSGMAPQFGMAGSLDARGALSSMLSGQPDYAGAQGAVDAANAPLLRQFNEELIPSLNTRATFLNNGTGGIKALNRALPELGRRMNENALSVYEGERQRALASRDQAANLVGQGGLAANAQGLQGAGMQSDLQRALASMNLSTDQARAGAQSDWRSQMLGLGSYFGNLAGNATDATSNALNMSPNIYSLGATPQNDMNRFAAWDRGLQEQQLAAQQAQFQQQQNYPRDMAQWYAQMVQPFGQQGGTSTSTTRTSQSTGLGDVLSAGVGIGSMFLPGIGPLASQGIMGAMAPNIMSAANNALQPVTLSATRRF